MHGRASLFDAAAFGVNEREASLMDPHQRLLLQAFAEAAAGAGGGIAADNSGAPSWGQGPRHGQPGPAVDGQGLPLLGGVSRREWGVYVGVSALDYGKLASR